MTFSFTTGTQWSKTPNYVHLILFINLFILVSYTLGKGKIIKTTDKMQKSAHGLIYKKK
jgi:hypothetical protein